MQDTQSKLSPLTIALHWLVALTIIGLLGVGLYMSRTHTYALYPIHKSIGIMIFAVIILRIIWRLKNGWPKPASLYQKWEQILARLVHYILLIGSFLIPASGLTMSVMGGHGAKVFGLEVFSRNIDPLNPNQTIPINADLATWGSFLHEYVSYIVIIALFLHIAGALKHHIIDKDPTLRRMLGQKI